MNTILNRIIEESCPYTVFDAIGHTTEYLNEIDLDTAVFGEDDIVQGCRGITCKECWNQESEE